jgi:CIC family chloride channel protein
MTELTSHIARPISWFRDRLASAHMFDGTMLLLGGLTGLATGVLAALLIAVIRIVQRVAFGAGPSAPWQVLLVPAAGALVVGLAVTYWANEPSGSGVVRTMETIALHGGRARKRTPLAGIMASGLALGTGASGGREGPIVLIGSSVGSLLGSAVGVGEDRLRALMAAGAAAGIGASFNAPIAGMMFAIELIIGGLRASSMQVIVVASVVGSVTARQIIGDDIIYEPEVAYAFTDPRELILYALLGLAAAGVGLAFLYGEDIADRLFTRLRTRIWRPLTLALGGLIVGAIGLVLPEVMGTGERLPPVGGVSEPIQQMLDGGFGTGWTTVGLLLLLLVAKLVATYASIGSGNAVGTFAPAVFTGVALGAAFGIAAFTLLPDVGIQPGAFALVGMAAVFAAAARAPLTAILIAFELTGDYELVLPLMLAAGIATFVAEHLNPESVYTAPLRKRGVVYSQPEDVDIMQTVRVREVMTTDHPTVRPDLPVPELRRLFDQTGSHGFAVVDDDRLVGVVSLSDLPTTDTPDPDRPRRDSDLVVRDVCTRRVLTVAPDDPVFRALHRMAAIDVGRIPVVDAHHHRFVGMIRRADVVRAYQRAIARSLTEQQHEESRRLRNLAGVRFVEFVVDPESEVVNRAVRDVAWPMRTVLTSIRRNGAIVMPTGDTVLEAHDEVVVLTPDGSTDAVRSLIGRRVTDTLTEPQTG